MPVTSVMWVTRRMPSRMRLICTISCSDPAICVRIALGGRLAHAHGHHVLEPGQRLARAVGVQRAHRAVVAGVHGLQQVDRLGAAHLAEDDAVGPHAQRVLHQVAHADLAVALEVGRPRLQAHDVRLLHAQLGGVLDGDDALAVVDHARQRVQHASSCPSRCRPTRSRFSRQRAAMRSTVAMAGEMLPCWAIWSKPIWRLPNFRIDTEAPSMASGGMMMLTRLPSSRRASQIGLDLVDRAGRCG